MFFHGGAVVDDKFYDGDDCESVAIVVGDDAGVFDEAGDDDDNDDDDDDDDAS